MVAAANCYKATLSVTTGLSAPFNNLAIIYKQQVMSSLHPSLYVFSNLLICSFLLDDYDMVLLSIKCSL